MCNVKLLRALLGLSPRHFLVFLPAFAIDKDHEYQCGKDENSSNRIAQDEKEIGVVVSRVGIVN